MALEEGRYFTGIMSDQRYNADPLAEYCRRFISSGVWELGDKLKVSASGGMEITINYGDALVDGYLYKLVDNSTGLLTLKIDNPDSQPRIDRVVIRKDKDSQRVNAYIKKGTPGASPAPPALDTTDEDYEISITRISVPTGINAITASNLTDERESIEINGAAPGRDGATWLSGITVPAAGIGNDSDFYFNSLTCDIYKKANGAWTFIVNIKGLTGTPGAAILSGTTAPAAGTGNNGDVYLNTLTSDLYQKVGGTWTLIVNLKGLPGTPGTQGIAGINGTGAGVDYVFNPSTAEADPGNGKFILNNATAVNITKVLISKKNSAGAVRTYLLDALANSTASVKGIITFVTNGTNIPWAFTVTGVTSYTGYYAFNVNVIGDATSLPVNGATYNFIIAVNGNTGGTGTNAPAVKIQYSADNSAFHDTFVLATDKYIRLSVDNGSTYTTGYKFIGDNGTGTGDVVGPAGAIADDIVTFDSTTGKLVKDSGKKLIDFLGAAAQATDSAKLGGSAPSAFATSAQGSKADSAMQPVSANRPGVIRLYRVDDDSPFNVQTIWDGTRWVLQGYNGATYHAPCRVGYADAAWAANALDGYRGASYAQAADSNYIDSGWCYIQGNAATSMTQNVNFNVTFASAPRLILTPAGFTKPTNQGVPTGPGDINSSAGAFNLDYQALSTTGFTARFSRSSSFANTGYYLYNWMAIGTRAR